MAERKPRVDFLRIQSQKVRADVAEFVTGLEYDFSVGQVAQLTMTIIDPTSKLDNTPIATLGTSVTMSDTPGATWVVGAIDATYGAGITWQYDCRSRLAKQLRRTFKAGLESEVSPSDWVRRRVRQAGGRSVTQKSSKRIDIGQAGGKEAQSSLDIVDSLAGELEWAWVEFDNTLYMGDPYWALTGGPGLPTWPVTWKSDPGSDALAVAVRLSDDDTETAGTLDLSLPHEFGRRLRPWHRVDFRERGRFAGIWLVESVSFSDDDVSPVEVSCSRPRKPRKKSAE